jgi:hypothetical protein
VIGTDASIVQLPFVAPGRRRLFIDRFVDAARQTHAKSCLPVLEPADFGFDSAELEALRRAGGLDLLGSLVAGREVDGARMAALDGDTKRRLEAASRWAAGCTALADEPAAALRHFERAVSLAPEGGLYAPSVILAHARLGRWPDVEKGLQNLSWTWQRDPRYGVVLALVGSDPARLREAEAWLQAPAEKDGEGGEIAAPPLVTSAYFYVLLSRAKYARAQDYAQRMALRCDADQEQSAEWLERAGDAAAFARRLGEARALYEKSRARASYQAVLLLKLSDVAFLEGDLKTERSLRERFYGRLREAQ